MQEPRYLCLDCGYPIEGLSQPRCPECGLGFDLSDPATYRDRLEDRRPLYWAGNLLEAQRLGALLQAEGIRAGVRGELPVVGEGALLPGLTPPLVVEVPAEDLERSLALLAEFRQGLIQAGDPDAGPWRCPHCGETIEAQFSACWQCGRDRP